MGAVLVPLRWSVAGAAVCAVLSILIGSQWDEHCSDEATGLVCSTMGYGVIVASCVLMAAAGLLALVGTRGLLRARGISRRAANATVTLAAAAMIAGALAFMSGAVG